MLKRIYWALGLLILGGYAWAEMRGLDFPSGERERNPGTVRGSLYRNYRGGK